MRTLIAILLLVFVLWLYQERQRLSKQTAELSAKVAKAKESRLEPVEQVKPWFQRHLDGAANRLDRPAQPVAGRAGARRH